MDDLSALDWSSTSDTNKTSKAPPNSTNPPNAFAYPSLRPTPSPFSSGHNTPLSNQASGSSSFKPPPQKPAQDSFSNLVNFGHAKNTANLSLRERQERLEAEKRKKQDDLRKQAQANYGDGRFFDTLASNSGVNSRTASPALSNQPAQERRKTDSDDDLFAAFNAETKVDNDSHYPPPAESASRTATPASGPALDLSDPGAWGANAQSTSHGGGGFEDDDPFDLGQLNSKPSSSAAVSPANGGDDDFLGDLAKPVEEVRRKAKASQPQSPEPGKPIEDGDSDSSAEQAVSHMDDPFDRAVAELVDYGFSPENARRGLTESGAGLNVQAAANWLLDDAHRAAKEKSQGQRRANGRDGRRQVETKSSNGTDSAAWMAKGGDARQHAVSTHQNDGDFAKTAAAMGTSFLKSANSLWKTSQKKMQQAVADFQQDADPSQPKWMRSAQADHPSSRNTARQQDVTDEAMMLEGGAHPDRKPQSMPPTHTSSRTQAPAAFDQPERRHSPVPRWQQAKQPPVRDPRARLNHQSVEEQSAQAYVSPARRKKPSPQPARETLPSSSQPTQDISFRSSPRLASRTGGQQQAPAPQNTTTRPSAPPSKPAPKLPPRQIPPCSPASFQSSNKHRLDGTAHFKRGDYAAAHASYSSSLAAIPSTHPLAIVLLCNRALTALKTGEPRQAVDDADAALAVIGPGKGENELVALEDGTSEKRDMRDLYGKALTRKAEGLEQMEKWSDAMAVWQTCVEAGVGGATATAGRQRCQKALAPKPPLKAAAPSPRPTGTAARPNARRPPGGGAAAPAKDSDAVERLRAANKAAEAADGERFALVDQVDARIAAWRDGKRDNLRALLGSLDQVLWEGSGWKKVGLHELVLANKVKIVYMKAIAKCHPDKLAQDTSTEARMIAGTVFSTLNEAWDKFKADNGM
ncbi:uncharacterized protein E0L32_001865 [Thyridium curvatum]|uniref:UBA domain-containing protein n=1 Tax=Thyridium curvatum TaxID=1093900 RepID=A0A507AVM2_9PEZI|nr:uncharacterized protein E0L32_001814 [Thyridium curvatum]XP_030990001.1 uncharacterized protein E0L32_001865 [Thyridium curvatum]TPX08239.1 hypothetical protein E0L32_001814 [Thyridium curvatum]TPX08290.1 hypothetical protein E0L32_001865 [Thyridium curvatum]